MTTFNDQITEEWLRTIGFSRSMQPANGNRLTIWKGTNYISIELRNGHAVTAISDGDVAEYLPAGLCPTTRDDVLKLCDAFGFIKPNPKSEATQSDNGQDIRPQTADL